MNPEQVKGLIRQVLPFFAGLAVSRGWVTAEDATSIAGAILAIGSAVWSFNSKTQDNMVAKVAAMPQVKEIIMDGSTEEGFALARAVPSSKVKDDVYQQVHPKQ